MDDLSATAPNSPLFTSNSKKKKKLFKIKKPKWSKKDRSSDIAEAIFTNPSEPTGESTLWSMACASIMALVTSCIFILQGHRKMKSCRGATTFGYLINRQRNIGIVQIVHTRCELMFEH